MSFDYLRSAPFDNVYRIDYDNFFINSYISARPQTFRIKGRRHNILIVVYMSKY